MYIRGWEMNRNQCNSFSGTDHTQHYTTTQPNHTTVYTCLERIAFVRIHTYVGCVWVRARIRLCVILWLETQMINFLWNLYLVNGLYLLHTVDFARLLHNVFQREPKCSCHTQSLVRCNRHWHRPTALVNKFTVWCGRLLMDFNSIDVMNRQQNHSICGKFLKCKAPYTHSNTALPKKGRNSIDLSEARKSYKESPAGNMNFSVATLWANKWQGKKEEFD